MASARISRNPSPTRSVRGPCGMGPAYPASSILGPDQLKLGVQYLGPVPPFDELLDLVHHPTEVMLVRTDGGDRDRGPLPQVLMLDLCHAHREALPERGGERRQDVSLLLQRSTSGDPQIEPLECDQRGRPQTVRAYSSTSQAS